MYSHIDTVILDRLAKNCIRLYYYWISFSSNMKLGGGGGGGWCHTDPSRINYLQKSQSKGHKVEIR